MEPLVARIRRFALDDGPGIRTTIFLKGCPLACRWCHNPEAIRPGPEVVFEPARCVGAGDCARACPAGAIDLAAAGRVDRRRCDGCGRCAERCPSTALQLVGEAIPVDALVARVRRDRAFFDVSGGGVTFSGGEPTLHLRYVAAAARALGSERIHVAIQTCGEFDLARFREELLPWVDLVQFDLKLADPAAHRRYTGQDNARIVHNFRWLAAQVPGRLVARVPLVPGITDTSENLAALGALVRDAGCREHVLLPWNPGALAKRARLGERPDPALPGRLLRPEEEAAARLRFGGLSTPRDAQPGGGPS